MERTAERRSKIFENRSFWLGKRARQYSFRSSMHCSWKFSTRSRLRIFGQSAETRGRGKVMKDLRNDKINQACVTGDHHRVKEKESEREREREREGGGGGGGLPVSAINFKFALLTMCKHCTRRKKNMAVHSPGLKSTRAFMHTSSAISKLMALQGVTISSRNRPTSRRMSASPWSR